MFSVWFRRLLRLVGPALGALASTGTVFAARASEWSLSVDDSSSRKLSRVETVSAMVSPCFIVQRTCACLMVRWVLAQPKSLALKTQVFGIVFCVRNFTLGSQACFTPDFVIVCVSGNYENRLRRHSAPEKVFEYFASVNIDGTWYMTPDDFIRAITPYNPAIDDWNTVGSRNDKFSSRWPAPKLAGVRSFGCSLLVG
jgi:hypothetical protein